MVNRIQCANANTLFEDKTSSAKARLFHHYLKSVTSEKGVGKQRNSVHHSARGKHAISKVCLCTLKTHFNHYEYSEITKAVRFPLRSQYEGAVHPGGKGFTMGTLAVVTGARGGWSCC